MLDLYHGKQHEVSGNDKLQGTGDNDPISLKPPSKVYSIHSNYSSSEKIVSFYMIVLNIHDSNIWAWH